MEASVPSLPVIVEQVNLPELTDEDVGRIRATGSPGCAEGLHKVSATGTIKTSDKESSKIIISL